MSAQTRDPYAATVAVWFCVPTVCTNVHQGYDFHDVKKLENAQSHVLREKKEVKFVS
jgi:hypothetical protein